MKSIKALHFCPVKLGLALPVAIFYKSGIQVGIFDNKIKSDTPEKYELLKKNKEYELFYKDTMSSELIKIHDVFNLVDGVESISEYFKSEILIITIAGIDEAREAIAYTIREIVKKREKEKKYTLIIACENGHRVSSLYKNKVLRDDESIYTFFFDCIVDRVVSYLDTKKSEIIINTESFGLWEIFLKESEMTGIPAINKMIEYLKKGCDALKIEIKFIDDQYYESYFIKKTYCVNGIHYALSMIQEYIWREEIGDDRKYLHELLDDPDLMEFTLNIIGEIREAAKREMRFLSEDNLDAGIYEELDEYFNKFLIRIKYNEDTRSRIFKNLFQFDEVYRKLHENIEEYSQKEIIAKLNLNDFEVKFHDRIISPIKSLRRQKREQTVNLLDTNYISNILSLESLTLASVCVLGKVTERVHDIISMLEEQERIVRSS
ncbi:MAG: hypothetical protein K9N06_07790 [Candidatus Cloacimonetes bacterium]|nr:hypothetical protein [Candidatus Cloacimonadota bacterium]